MSPTIISPFRRAWLKWKALHLPWRKRFLVGNTFWEFRDTLSSHQHRMRRIVNYTSSVHYSDIKISPQWHQWLRHTRENAPSIVEQSQDLVRQRNLKILAAEADARWAAKPSVLDSPGKVRGQLPVRKGQVEPVEGTKGERVGGSVGAGLEGYIRDLEPAVINAVDGLTDKKRAKTHIKRPQQLVNGRPEEKRRKEDEQNADPWRKQGQGGSSEQWQPKAWDESAVEKR